MGSQLSKYWKHYWGLTGSLSIGEIDGIILQILMFMGCVVCLFIGLHQLNGSRRVVGPAGGEWTDARVALVLRVQYRELSE